MLRAIFIRHGEADYSFDSLTAKGKAQVLELADVLSPYLEDRAFKMHVSTAGRTRDTAESLCGTGMYPEPQYTEALKFGGRESYIQGDGEHVPRQCKNLILVSHRGRIESNVAQLCGEKVFQQSIPGLKTPEEDLRYEPDLNYAEAVVLDFDGEDWAVPGELLSMEILRRDI